MQRKEFIQTCSYACLGLAGASMFLSACGSSKHVTAVLNNDHLVVETSVFELNKKDKTRFRQYVLVNHDRLKHPIYLYRASEKAYTALYMECTHQGAELSAYGDRLQCAAHGSEFNHLGEVQNGPATSPLRSFPIQLQNNQIRISLQKL